MTANQKAGLVTILVGLFLLVCCLKPVVFILTLLLTLFVVFFGGVFCVFKVYFETRAIEKRLRD